MTDIAIHETQFHRNLATGLARAVCTCGWVKFGSLEECQAAAAAHDGDEWQAVEVATAPAPAHA